MRERKLVREGYDQVAVAYLERRRRHAPDLAVLEHLTSRLPMHASILDAGCGAGVPIGSYLAERFEVIGVDFSLAQLRLARDLVPTAKLACQDLTALGFASSSFDAVCSFYAVIHVPRDLHFGILTDFHRLLVPGGLALLCLGADDLKEDIESDYFGVEMYWSHYDEAANRQLLTDIGFQEEWSGLVPDVAFGEGRHLFVLARKGYA